MQKRIRRPVSLKGTVIVPGDKSISHRAAIFNALAAGNATIDNFLAGEDCQATLDCLSALGVPWRWEPVEGGRPRLYIEGRGLHGLREAEDVLDAANSGTTMRLLAGVLAGQPFLSILTGDALLRRRPMDRIAEPLRTMGAQVWGRAGDTYPPLVIRGGPLRGIRYRLPVASAQVKSAVLLAGLYAEGDTIVEEPTPTRDHSERMLSAMGASLTREAPPEADPPGRAQTGPRPGEAVWPPSAGGVVRLTPPSGGRELSPLDLAVPGDVSAASFWMVAAALHPEAEVCLPAVGINPTRAGLIEVLREMGADVELAEERLQGGEPVADFTVRSSRLSPVEVGGDLIPRLIDEVPVLAVAAALTPGRTVIRDAAELRLKESDRISTTCRELARLGADIEELPEGLAIEGVSALRGALCSSHGDHRLAMALAVAGLLAHGETVIDGAEAVSVSYPGFWEDLERLAQ